MTKTPNPLPIRLHTELLTKTQYLKTKKYRTEVTIANYIRILNNEINACIEKAITNRKTVVEIKIPEEEIKDFTEFYVPYLENSGFEYKILEKKGWFWGKWLVVRLNLE